MVAVKLQICCMIILGYFLVSYEAEGRRMNISCNKIFDWILRVSPFAIFFDGATAITVNHRDVVPDWVNLVLHAAFFISMNIVLILMFYYMVTQTIGIRVKEKAWHYLIPGMVGIALTIVFMPELDYIAGEKTDYSMGTSVIISFASTILHCIAILVMVFLKRKTIEKRKQMGLMALLSGCIALILVQCVFPEILITSILPLMVVTAIYCTFEDPSAKRMQKINDDMVTGFATLVENRDDSTGGHIKRTQGYVSIILDEMRHEKKYKPVLTKDYQNNVKNAAPMHDIGKISTPDSILQKPGKLTDEEFEIMKEHSKRGGEIILDTFEELNDPDYIQVAFDVATYHHEKWNGKGYPEGRSGEDIPLHARIMAIADVFDAVSADRCYRKAMPLEKCFGIIEEGSGSDFDPDLVRLFLGAKDKVVDYYKATS